MNRKENVVKTKQNCPIFRRNLPNEVIFGTNENCGANCSPLARHTHSTERSLLLRLFANERSTSIRPLAATNFANLEIDLPLVWPLNSVVKFTFFANFWAKSYWVWMRGDWHRERSSSQLPKGSDGDYVYGQCQCLSQRKTAAAARMGRGSRGEGGGRRPGKINRLSPFDKRKPSPGRSSRRNVTHAAHGAQRCDAVHCSVVQGRVWQRILRTESTRRRHLSYCIFTPAACYHSAERHPHS